MEFPGIILDTSTIIQIQKPARNILYDMLIVGAGPAAMSAAVYAARKMINLAILTIDFGGLMNETTEIENYLGFQNINARDLVSRFEEHVKSFEIPANYGVPVKEIKKKDDFFSVFLEDGTVYSGRTVIFTTGERHRELRVPGGRDFVGKGISYCATCDAPLFRDKKVIIIGGGNSAFTTALDLIRVNAEIILVNLMKEWQADEILKQRVKKYEKIHFLDNHEIIRIEGKDKVESCIIKNRDTGEEKRIDIDAIFIEIGLLPNSAPVKNLVELNEEGEVIVDCLCRTSVRGLFSAGDVTSVPYKQIIISAGEGAKAALSAYDYLVRTSLI
ncbi:MAG: FAD-dependent oxidoreductase [Nitrospirae bacterium]|jgi:NADH-dependent peroxiredoxin subunit F|nr:FAD-dependent oxidoreductase [Nitrospirota bacterium]